MSQAKDNYYEFKKEADSHHEGLCDKSFEYIQELENTLADARNYIQNLWNTTDFCTCPKEGDCVCGQTEMINIMKKIDEVIL